MSRLVDINLRPDARTLRQFGWISLVGFAFLALLAWTESLVFSFGLGTARDPVALAFVAVGVVAAVFGVVAPKANLPIYLLLTVVALPIGFVLSYVIMGTIFYLIIAPIGLALRLSRRNPIETGFLPEAQSYFTDPRPNRGRESYFKQF